LGVREPLNGTDVHQQIRAWLVAGSTPGLSVVLTRTGR